MQKRIKLLKLNKYILSGDVLVMFNFSHRNNYEREGKRERECTHTKRKSNKNGCRKSLLSISVYCLSPRN